MAQRVSAIASFKPWVGDILSTFIARVLRSPIWIVATAIFVFSTAFFLHFWMTARGDLASIKADGQQVSSFGRQTEVMKALAADVSSAWDSVNVALYAYDSLDAARVDAPAYAHQVRAAFGLGREANSRVDDALGKVKAASLSDPTIGRFKALDGRELLNLKDDLSARQALLVAEMSHDPGAVTQARENLTRQLKSSARTEFEVSVAQGHLSADLAAEEAENKTALSSISHRIGSLLIASMIWVACIVFAACYLVAIRIGLIRSAQEVFRTW